MTKIQGLEVHPFADIFPLMTDDEFQRLVDDIRAHGQQQNIITYRGKVIDGRNRQNACIACGLEPKYEEWNEQGSLINFIISVNLHRRHLTESQRAMVAARMANLKSGETKQAAPCDAPLSQTDASELVNVSRRSTQRAAFVQSHADPEIVQKVESGEMTVTEAEREVKRLKPLPKGKQKRLLKIKRNKLKELGNNLIVKKAKQTNKENGVVCLVCNPDLEATENEFIVHLTALRARVPAFARYIDPIISEIAEMELSNPVREAKDKILAAVDLGLLERKQIKSKTVLDDQILDGALAYLVEYGELVILEQNKITEQARGQKKQLYVRPQETDPNLKALCVDCDMPVGAGYKKLDDDLIQCRRCRADEEEAIRNSQKSNGFKITMVEPTTRDFKKVLGKYKFVDRSGRALTDYENFQEIIINEDDFADSLNQMPLNKFRIYLSLKEEFQMA